MTDTLRIGCAVDAFALDDPAYRDAIARLFTVVTAENAMKFLLLRPDRDTYDFANADRIMEFAEAEGKAVRGHTLAWHSQLSEWVADAPAEERAGILRDHIDTVVGRYRGRIEQWDVVNEALDDDAQPRESPWFEAMGIDYIADAFRWAHEADPSARLFLNDYNVEDLCPKSDAYYELAKQLLANGVPLHGFGIQGHRIVGDPPTSMRENLQRFADLGLEVALTEVDVRMPVTEVEHASDVQLAAQAADYRTMIEAARAVPACTSFVLWGLSDAHSWIPETFAGFGAAHVFDEALRPKPAFEAVFSDTVGPSYAKEPVLR
ncbi:endo-1,4-beta-xylanase [Planctomonas sp. JC2975]|uniref:endo-1,4-beta-xylanase n=1 Tax=Planctomonas sp. JC2975 TaxID=2729626 RepID=UPI001473EB70|nr:endo-1,4-beta-xylanase [Planctomonas sp. JC2975]NNC12377.1 endo-1,4-beta-xylanase [Planctomonas sp. JC2975]